MKTVYRHDDYHEYYPTTMQMLDDNPKIAYIIQMPGRIPIGITGDLKRCTFGGQLREDLELPLMVKEAIEYFKITPKVPRNYKGKV